MENNSKRADKKITIAIDGYSSSGKSTMARELARRVGYIYVDSGAMYRAVTLYALRHGFVGHGKPLDREALVAALPEIHISFAAATGSDGVQHTLLNGEDVESQIRDLEVSSYVSPVAEVAEVRRALVRLQQEMGREKGIVMDGRDIGTAVFPDAEMKVFVDASASERARRRLRELEAKGEKVSYDEVLHNIEERDRIDTTREVSPLRKADDAHVLDNSTLTREDQMKWLIDLFDSITASHE
ncbi:MAG: (d)CMP kinase [Muribaculaceae bacterium]|nr:(d)CMP kinase [Muribaculaceae bacterium]